MKPAQMDPDYYRRPVDSVLMWLAIATYKLAPSAQARICAEIEAHYAEAVRGHVEQGLAEPDARAKALADLGSPQKAARRFRRTYLTQSDAKVFAGWLKDCNRVSLATVLVTPWILFLLFYFQRSDDAPLSRVWWMLLATGYLLFICVMLLWRRIARQPVTLRNMYRLNFLMNVGWPVLFVIIFLACSFHGVNLIYAVGLGIGGIAVWLQYRFKLSAVGEDALKALSADVPAPIKPAAENVRQLRKVFRISCALGLVVAVSNLLVLGFVPGKVEWKDLGLMMVVFTSMGFSIILLYRKLKVAKGRRSTDVEIT